MEYEKIKNWLKDNDYQNSGLRTDRNHRIDLYLSDVLYHYSKETVHQLESRIKELEQTIENMKAIAGEKIEPINVVSSVDYTTELITKNEGSFYEITTTKCCGIGPITRENFCPNCGRKIVR